MANALRFLAVAEYIILVASQDLVSNKIGSMQLSQVEKFL